MKKSIFICLFIAACLPFTACKKQEPAASSPQPDSPPPASAAAVKPGAAAAPAFTPARKTSYEDVTAQLDPGGSVFLYLATDQWLSGVSAKVSDLRQLVLGLPGVAGPERGQVNLAFDVLARLAKSSGVEDLNGVGLSGVQIAPELYRTKMILHHGPGAGKGFLWNLFGRAPHGLTGLDLLPKNTGLAVFGDFDVGQVWQILERELAQAGVPELANFARAWPQLFEQRTQIPWPQFLGSLGGELGLALTLDETRRVTLPLGRNPIELPEPGLLLAVKVNDDLLYDRISGELEKNPQTVKVNEPELKLCAMPLPVPLPLPLQLVAARSGGYFFLATSPDLVRTAVATRQGKQPGLRSTPEFQTLARHVPSQGNQFSYVNRRFSETVLNIQKQVMQSGGLPPEALAIMDKLVFSQEPSYGLSVGGHTASGWQTVSVGNRDSSAAMLVVPAVAVPAIGAGLLLPALAKAKSRAQTINSVNQLKQIGLAARMYANDHGDKFPPAETWCDALKEYLGDSAKVLKSPGDSGTGPCSYGYNSRLSGLDESKINPQTVAFFETEAGWNQHGGQESLLPKPRYPGVYVIGFADGSVQQVSEARIGSLRWDP